MDSEIIRELNDLQKELSFIDNSIKLFHGSSPKSRVACATNFRYYQPRYYELDVSEDIQKELYDSVTLILLKHKAILENKLNEF